jgi:UDP-2-acetamido-3-amino-2,3-dideoxy-glucuronate N-acetyltransferase
MSQDRQKSGKVYSFRHNPISNSNIKRDLIDRGCVIHHLVWIGDKVHIGRRVKIQAFAYIPNGVFLDDDVFISPGVTFTNDKYPPSKGKSWMDTRVEKGASIGANATIVCGVTIGRGAIVGAGAVVTRDVPAGWTVVGIPAKKLKKPGEEIMDTNESTNEATNG